MNEPTANQPGPQPFERLEQVGTVELDRYCGDCGYNLRQQAVRRETATKLLMCRCPECGTFEPANTLTTATRSWARSLILFAWILWFVLWLNLVGWSIFGVTGLAVVSGDIRRNWVEMEQVNLNQIAENDVLQNYRKSLNNTNNNNTGGGVNQVYYHNNVITLSPMRGEDAAGVALFLVLAAAIGAVMTTITVVAMPHWRRWWYVCFAVGWPLIGILIFHGLLWRELYNWRLVTVDLMRWHLGVAVSIETVAIVGGLAAVWLGRPISRGIIRMIVPPKARGVFAYLWLADGKTPPKTV